MAATDYKAAREKREQKKRERQKQRTRERNRQRRDRNVLRLYKDKRPDLPLGKFEFRFVVLRAKNKKLTKFRRIEISDQVESCNWLDEGVVLTGQVVVRTPEHDRDHSAVRDGDMIKCEVRWGGKWREIWRMRVWASSETISDGTVTLDLYDDLRNLEVSKISVEYTKTKKGKHKKGWRASEIVADLAKRFRFKLGKVAKGKRKITDLTMDKVSGIDPIIKAYKLEQEETGKQYVLRWKNGKLNVLPLRRQKLLYTLKDQIREAIIGHARDEKFFTALKATANLSKGDSKKKDKIETTVLHREAVKRYGYIEHEWECNREVDSKAQLIKLAKRKISKSVRKRTLDEIQISHSGIPFIRKGDAIRVLLPAYGFKDKPRPQSIYKGGHKSILFVKSASHSIVAGDYTMDLTLGIEDPYAEMLEDVREKRDEKRREEKRQKRKKAAA